MAQYIDKDKVVAEIKKIKLYIGSDKYLSDFEKGCNFGREDVCDSLLNFIDTLEVKETDLENEFFDWYHEEKNKDYNASILYEKYDIISKKLAKHFYELGLKAQKGE